MISGITSTGKITLGNYLGAIKNFVSLQDEYEMFIFIANLHGITMPIEKLELKENIKNLAALYFACGLDPEKSHVFLQSDVKEHAELGWILTCNTTIGELSRMTQYKDKATKAKSANGTDFVPSGLLMYPCLMAADILLYDADFVPVGIDQKQHIELTRNIADRMNNKYGEMFKVPDIYTPKVGAKIMNLQDPTSKMSKSDETGKGVIFLLDEENVIRKKIKSAVTDSDNSIKYDIENKPGVSNLMTIYSSITKKTMEQIEKEFKDKNYGEFKDTVAESVVSLIIPIQKKYKRYLNSDDVVEFLEKGKKTVSILAEQKLKKVTKKIGLDFRK